MELNPVVVCGALFEWCHESCTLIRRNVLSNPCEKTFCIHLETEPQVSVRQLCAVQGKLLRRCGSVFVSKRERNLRIFAGTLFTSIGGSTLFGLSREAIPCSIPMSRILTALVSAVVEAVEAIGVKRVWPVDSAGRTCSLVFQNHRCNRWERNTL